MLDAKVSRFGCKTSDILFNVSYTGGPLGGNGKGNVTALTGPEGLLFFENLDQTEPSFSIPWDTVTSIERTWDEDTTVDRVYLRTRGVSVPMNVPTTTKSDYRLIVWYEPVDDGCRWIALRSPIFSNGQTYAWERQIKNAMELGPLRVKIKKLEERARRTRNDQLDP